MQKPSRPKTRRKYDADFKNEAVKMLANGQTVAYVSNALGVSENLIYRWKNQNQGVKKVSSEQSELALENQQLKDRVRQLETEREILKKARRAAPLSIFSRQT
ncbi:transposase [Spirosoma validum]|uniref:Transposase n=1 Tax=Spirosoma validum TaxID=2771355 RepID=A0A927B735_9BACT|nr:transposase [Spirosoma validum]MBD2756584.1 transposase [Spirosoma validum]